MFRVQLATTRIAFTAVLPVTAAHPDRPPFWPDRAPIKRWNGASERTNSPRAVAHRRPGSSRGAVRAPLGSASRRVLSEGDGDGNGHGEWRNHLLQAMDELHRLHTVDTPRSMLIMPSRSDGGTGWRQVTHASVAS